MTRRETVTEVIDGDTFKTASRKHAVRLANVNAPEKGAPESAKAREALKGLIDGEQVRVNTVTRDKYGRSLATVKLGSKSVNRAMNQKLRKWVSGRGGTLLAFTLPPLFLCRLWPAN